EVVHAAHFTPQLMAAALREAFGVNVGDAGIAPVGPGSVADRRFASSISNPTLSAVTGSNSRSPTVPPIALSRTRASASRMNTVSPGTDGFDGPAASALAPRPAWRRGSFWLVALLCAGGIGAGVGTSVWNTNRQSGSGVGTGAALAEASPAPGDTRSPRSTKKPRRIPILIQSDPEGADIFVAGRFESVGTTPRWVTLDLDPSVPTRVMVRKPGFQDKAIAVESDKPPVVQLIPIDADLASTVGSGRRQASGEGATSDTARDEKARRERYRERQRQASKPSKDEPIPTDEAMPAADDTKEAETTATATTAAAAAAGATATAPAPPPGSR
ncbi:MAG: hypothetical protein ABIS92_17370, partial [Polyangia bacterium]